MAVFVKRNRFLLEELPYEKLTHIQSTGTQCIRVGFTPNQDTRVVTKVYFPSADTTNQFIFGSRKGTYEDSYGFNHYNGTYYTHYNTGAQGQNYGNVSYDFTFVIDKNKNITTINGEHTITHNYDYFTCPGELILFAENNNGTIKTYASAIMEYCKVYNNGILIRDYIPVLMRFTQEVGLWDKVNRVFYGNAGSGAFIAGEMVA